MNKLLWSIPGATIYLYALTILTQYGFLSYFNIPTNFITFSPVDSTLLAYNLFKLGLAIITLIHWWWWALFAIIIVIVIFFDKEDIIAWTITTLSVLFLYNAVNFGNFIAKNQTRFLTLPSNCPSVVENATTTYVIPATYDTKIALVPVDTITRKMTGGFFVKDMSKLPCQLEYKEIGKIGK